MAIVEKRAPYELLLRFGFHNHPHADIFELGELIGGHYIENTYLVDSRTGEVKSMQVGLAQDIPPKLQKKYLTSTFVSEVIKATKKMQDKTAQLDAAAERARAAAAAQAEPAKPAAPAKKKAKKK